MDIPTMSRPRSQRRVLFLLEEESAGWLPYRIELKLGPSEVGIWVPTLQPD